MHRAMLRTVYIRNVKKKNVPFVYRTCILYSFFMSMHCSLWRSIFFSTVREYGKTDCIRVNCNIHGNISGIEEGRQILLLFPKISNVLRYVLSRLSTYFLFHEFIHTFIHILQRKGKEIHNKYVNFIYVIFIFKKFFCNHQLYIRCSKKKSIIFA